MIRNGKAIRSRSDLTETLIDAACHSRCKIQAAGLGLGHHGEGNAVRSTEGGTDPFMDSLGHAAKFLTKKQVVAAAEVGAPVRLRPSRGEEPEALRSLRLQVRIPGCMLHAVHMLPVIKPRAPSRLLVHVESDRMNDVQAAVSGHGGAADVARVLRDLRLVQHDVEERILHGARRVRGERACQAVVSVATPRYDAQMELVLLSNVIWMVFLAGWCVLYFMQAKIDRSSGGRYSDYREEP